MKKILNTLSGHKLFLLILFSGIALRIWNVGWSLPELYEEATPFARAWAMWNWGNSGFDLNPHFFHYPAFTFYLQFAVQSIQYLIGSISGAYQNSAAFLQAYQADPTVFIILARLVSILFDAGTIIVVYLFALTIEEKSFAQKPDRKKSTFRLLGIFTAIFIVINPLLIQQAHTITVDTPLVFFTTISLLLIYKLYFAPSIKLYVWIGICIGLAAATKYTGAFLFPIAFLAQLLKEQSWKAGLRSLFSSRMVIVVISSVIIFFAFNPYILMDTKDFVKDFSFEQEHMATGHLGVDSSTNGFVYYFLKLLPENLGWVLTGVMLLSTLLLIGMRKKQYVLLISFPILYLVIISLWNMRVERYILPVVPILLLFASFGMLWFVQMLGKFIPEKTIRQSHLVTIIIALVFLVVVGFSSIQQTLSYQSTASFPDTRTTAKQWLIQQYPQHAAIASGPFGIHIPKDKFKEFQIPFTPTGAENLYMFYQAQWYEDFDLLIASDYDYSRFAEDPVKYKDILPYYDSLHSNWTLVHEIKPGTTSRGPTFWFYTHRKPTVDSFPSYLFEKFDLLADSNEADYFTENLSSVLFKAGKLEKSEQLLKLALHYEPNAFNILRELAYVSFKQNKFDDVVRTTTQSLSLNPQQYEMTALQGSALLRLTRFDEAEAMLLKAISMNRTYQNPYFDLDLLYRFRGDAKAEINILTQLLSILPPDDENAKWIGARIRILQITN